jgi:hypothetical protein
MNRFLTDGNSKEAAKKEALAYLKKHYGTKIEKGVLKIFKGPGLKGLGAVDFLRTQGVTVSYDNRTFPPIQAGESI